MLCISKITLYAENGKQLDANCNNKFKKGHILLGLATCNPSIMDKNSVMLSPEDIEKLNKFCIDKTKSKVNHHFNTTGKSFSFGYDPKYDKTNKYGYSIGKYADKKVKKLAQ